MKVGHEVKLDRNLMSMLRWMCIFNFKERKKLFYITWRVIVTGTKQVVS